MRTGLLLATLCVLNGCGSTGPADAGDAGRDVGTDTSIVDALDASPETIVDGEGGISDTYSDGNEASIVDSAALSDVIGDGSDSSCTTKPSLDCAGTCGGERGLCKPLVCSGTAPFVVPSLPYTIALPPTPADFDCKDGCTSGGPWFGIEIRLPSPPPPRGYIARLDKPYPWGLAYYYSPGSCSELKPAACVQPTFSLAVRLFVVTTHATAESAVLHISEAKIGEKCP